MSAIEYLKNLEVLVQEKNPLLQNLKNIPDKVDIRVPSEAEDIHVACISPQQIAIAGDTEFRFNETPNEA